MNRATKVALGIGAGWGVVLLVLAAIVPFGTSETISTSSASGGTTQVFTRESSTLVEDNGLGFLAVIALPLLFVAMVAGLLWHRRAADSAGATAWSLTALLGALTFVSMLSIGIFVLPVTLALAVACSLAGDASRRSTPAGWRSPA